MTPAAKAPCIIAAMMNRFAHLLHGAIAESGLNPTTVPGLRSLLWFEIVVLSAVELSPFLEFLSVIFIVLQQATVFLAI